MERRDFLRLASVSGLGVVAGASAFDGMSEADAAWSDINTLFLMIDCGGGWDVTSLWDPKGYKSSPTDADRMNNYAQSAISSVGNFQYAPMALVEPDAVGTTFDDFFNTHYQELVVVNGIDNATNSHDAGNRVTWSGSLVEGGPTVAALIAASHLPTSPMGFITNGGYEETAGTVAAARTGNIDALRRIAFPNRIDAEDADSRLFHTEETKARIQEVRKARYDARLKAQRLPRIRNALSRLYTSRLGSNELKQLTEYLPDEVAGGLLGQGQLAIAAYRAGLCASANLRTGGFDTHGNNDQGQAQSLTNLLSGVMQILQHAEEVGVRERVCICIGSDFGRTPGYNDGNGKDHWSITSFAALGNVNGSPLKGNQVFGTTTYEHTPEDFNGTTITPSHVQASLRKLAGIADSEVAQMFPLENEETFDFFTT